MHKPESILKNEVYTRLWDLVIQTDHLISARRPNKKDNLQNSVHCHSILPQNKTERNRKRDNYLDLARELKKLWNMKVTVIPFVIGALGAVTKGLVQTRGLGNKKTSVDHPNDSIIKNMI